MRTKDERTAMLIGEDAVEKLRGAKVAVFGIGGVGGYATEALARATDYAGIYTGAKVDKFEKLGLTKYPSEKVACPTIAECPVSIECRVVEVIPMGTHDVFIADIVSVSCDDSILDEDGKIRFDKAGLLAYAHGEYFALGKKLGTFGFSTKKSGKKKQKR